MTNIIRVRMRKRRIAENEKIIFCFSRRCYFCPDFILFLPETGFGMRSSRDNSLCYFWNCSVISFNSSDPEKECGFLLSFFAYTGNRNNHNTGYNAEKIGMGQTR